MWIVIANNLPQLILGATWSGFVFLLGAKWGRWRAAHHFTRSAK